MTKLREHILVIDDEEPIREMLTGCLEDQGYRVTAAANAAEATALLEEHTYSLITLDLVLPDTAGFDFLITIKASAPHVPVLILTGMSYEEDILQGALAAGADGYLSKLDSLENLISEVRRLLKKTAAPLT